MTANTTASRVPHHLVGTREGLFHLLRGATIVPQDDAMARAELPRVTAYGDVLIQPPAPTCAAPAPVRDRSDRERIARFLQDDTFDFSPATRGGKIAM